MSGADELMDALDLVRLHDFDLTNVQIVEPFADVSGATEGPVWVHPESRCIGRDREIIGCCIHAPSDHPLKAAPLAWVSLAHCMIRVCEHGEGHTDPDDLAYRAWAAAHSDPEYGTMTVTDARELAVEGYQFSHDCPCKCCVAAPA